jgi:hypothetical protein
LAPKVISRTKPATITHKIKYTRLANEDKEKKKKGGMYTDSDEVYYETDPQLRLINLNTVNETWADWDDKKMDQKNQPSESTEAIREENLRFLQTLSS